MVSSGDFLPPLKGDEKQGQAGDAGDAAASPSRPSMRLMMLVTATSQKMVRDRQSAKVEHAAEGVADKSILTP